MMTDLDNFYLSKDEPNQSCLISLRKIILDQDAYITEIRKYGMPCFCYKNKMFCYLWIDRTSDEPYILMVEGSHLNHPHLEQGDRKRMKILRVNPHQDIAKELIVSILNEALNLYRSGIIKTKG